MTNETTTFTDRKGAPDRSGNYDLFRSVVSRGYETVYHYFVCPRSSAVLVNVTNRPSSNSDGGAA